MDEFTRQIIADAITQGDAATAEFEAWQAQQRQRRLVMKQHNGLGLVYKTTETPMPTPEPPTFTDLQVQAIGQALQMERVRMRAYVRAAIAKAIKERK
jgi:hypothetical protein